MGAVTAPPRRTDRAPTTGHLHGPTEDLVLGLDTFGAVPEDDAGATVSHAQAIRQVVTEATPADELGVDAVALGEHHRPEYAVSAPETVLAGHRIGDATPRTSR